jgi:hypothetical protein
MSSIHEAIYHAELNNIRNSKNQVPYAKDESVDNAVSSAKDFMAE